MNGIYQKLAEIQKELFVPKGQKNNFGNYNYRSCEDILKAVKPLCEKNGCVLYLTNDVREIGGKNYVEAKVTLVDLETGDSLSTTAMAREDENAKGQSPSQQSGSSISYSRKYALAGAFCIDNEKDADATNKHGKDDPEEKTYEVTAPEMGKMKLELLRTGYTEDSVAKKYGVKDITELTHAQYEDFMTKIKDVPDRKDVKKGVK